jgi:hypothetical protein
MSKNLSLMPSWQIGAWLRRGNIKLRKASSLVHNEPRTETSAINIVPKILNLSEEQMGAAKFTNRCRSDAVRRRAL